jgi:hypothetical protein
MFGGDPLAEPSPITPDDLLALHAQVVALTATLQALFDAFPDPAVARAIVRDRLETEQSMGLSREHWRPAEHDAVLRKLADVLTPIG